MHKAAQLSAILERLDVPGGIKVIEGATKKALHFEVIGDAMCIMHDDGSVNIVETMEKGVTVEVISAGNVLKVLQHYRPFKEVFKGNIQ